MEGKGTSIATELAAVGAGPLSSVGWLAVSDSIGSVGQNDTGMGGLTGNSRKLEEFCGLQNQSRNWTKLRLPIVETLKGK